MEFTPITGLQIRRDFYTSSGCVLEDVIENYFYQHFKTVNPYIIGRKESIAGKPTDGIIRFYDEEMHLKFWILQETKRDKGINSVFLHRSFLQALMYLGNIYYDITFIQEQINSMGYFQIQLGISVMFLEKKQMSLWKNLNHCGENIFEFLLPKHIRKRSWSSLL